MSSVLFDMRSSPRLSYPNYNAAYNFYASFSWKHKFKKGAALLFTSTEK
jgi:isocitrate lyase